MEDIPNSYSGCFGELTDFSVAGVASSLRPCLVESFPAISSDPFFGKPASEPDAAIKIRTKPADAHVLLKNDGGPYLFLTRKRVPFFLQG